MDEINVKACCYDNIYDGILIRLLEYVEMGERAGWEDAANQTLIGLKPRPLPARRLFTIIIQYKEKTEGGPRVGGGGGGDPGVSQKAVCGF